MYKWAQLYNVAMHISTFILKEKVS